jgi:predicted beta-xylosidase
VGKKHFKKFISAICVMTVLCFGVLTLPGNVSKAFDTESLIPVSLVKSDSGNPMLGFDENGDILYGGDPSVLVDGDTVYCYVGHDTSSNESYWMPDWRCYSSKDMINWKYESIIMVQNTQTVTWAANDHEAWAAQVIKYNGNYYFYYCTEANGANGGGKSIGVAISDSPTGPFKDIGKALVRNIDTYGGSITWEDIDPTVWVDTDEDGTEHRYLAWGNTRFFTCELNEDMISIKDQDGNPDKLSVGYGKGNDIVLGVFNGMNHTYTEAPYLYRQQDLQGNYYGKYYLFFAVDWREQMAYATTDDIMSGEWDFGDVIMEPSATANTNHMAVFDFKGQTYFVYHDGSLPHGSGYRRVACVEPFSINPDGTIDYIPKMAVGLTGTAGAIMDYKGQFLSHEYFQNVISDSFYPIKGKQVYCSYVKEDEDSMWELNPGKTDKNNEQLVSIESNNKPGLYLGIDEADFSKVVLSQDVYGTDDEAQRMTFRTYKGLNGKGVTFESVKYPGYFLVSDDGSLSLTAEPDKNQASFIVETNIKMSGFQALKTKRMYAQGDVLDVSDIQVTLYPEVGIPIYLLSDKYKTNADTVDMSETGDKTITVTYTDNDGNSYQDDIVITVVEPEYFGK